MERIASFAVDHNKLKRGIYQSRLDEVGSDFVTTFDLRMKLPNREPVIDVPALHTIEHIGATFLRNHPVYKDKVVYFGPMGCRTGFYLIVKGRHLSGDVLPLVRELFAFIRDYTGDIPGAKPEECGNYLSQDLPMARFEAWRYVDETLADIAHDQLHYPE
jgi:S-ribosylhomocysteine lyase